MSNPTSEQTPETPSEDREQKKFEVLSRPASLRGSLILLAAGVLLFTIVFDLGGGLRLIPTGLGVLGMTLLVMLTAGLLTLIVTAQLAGTNYGTLKEMAVKLTALNAFLPGMGWLLLLLVEWMLAGHDIVGLFSFGPILTFLAFLLWILVAASLYGNYFDLEFPEALGTFLLVSIVETTAVFGFAWAVLPADGW